MFGISNYVFGKTPDIIGNYKDWRAGWFSYIEGVLSGVISSEQPAKRRKKRIYTFMYMCVCVCVRAYVHV